ncbi:sulfite exporter TauE/SafE family protein [Kribbella solani]|uniref:sulfite exporter TauE/SafE family protein n=1 Tax=Kribbella solani TaxID=236067 RepID=UPI0029BB3772|nr:sulfite exporter TauE/SafE family protein [Kribbella solani]MDX3001726.1 sulfite exporter TauE/SafE family protein [Kribbella solani]
MCLEQFLFLGAAATAASALGSALGMAGGIFIVPLLTLCAGASFPAAVAISLISVIACSCASAPQFLSAGLTNLRLAVVLEVATTLGALAGLLTVGLVRDQVLYGIFATVLLVSAFQMMSGRRTRDSAIQVGLRLGDLPPGRSRSAAAHHRGRIARRLRLDSSYRERDASTVRYEVARLPTGLSLMFGAGMLSALLGIGSGVLKIPALDAAMRLPIKVSSATANLTIGVTACGTAAAHLIAGDLNLTLATPIVLGSLTGSALGARLLTKLAGTELRVVFTLVLLALAIPMTLNAFGARLGGLW